jgi:predicted nucleotide-binding protein
MKIVVVGSLNTVPYRQEVCPEFVARLGSLIVERGHTLLTGCRGSLDKAIGEAANRRLQMLGKDPSAHLVSYRLRDAEPVFRYGSIRISGLTDWELTHPDLAVPEQIASAHAAVFIAGGEGTLRAANWARIAGLPVLGVAQFGGAAESLYWSEKKRFGTKYAKSITEEEFEVLIQDTLDTEVLAEKVVCLAERIGPKAPCVFIGHGRSSLWARVQTFLENDLRLKTISYESGSRAGESIVPVLESMLQKATFAVLVMTAEDQGPDGSKRARQNVVHEAGLFQGQLGFNRAILLQQNGVEDFSNVAGLQYIPFDGENIASTFWELQRVLKREGMIP